LEQGTLRDLRAAKETTQRLIEYGWRVYSELALQRSGIEERLKHALNRAAIGNFSFRGWQRAVRYRYSLHPLCIVGSLKDPGGRFNIGDIDPARFPQFPALYLALDKDTALQETLGQVPPAAGSGLSAQEIALTNPQSVTIVSVSGTLERIIDLRAPERLKAFVELIKDFTISPELKKEARELGVPGPGVVKTPKRLAETLRQIGEISRWARMCLPTLNYSGTWCISRASKASCILQSSPKKTASLFSREISAGPPHSSTWTTRPRMNESRGGSPCEWFRWRARRTRSARGRESQL
jgi:hypothetical protein